MKTARHLLSATSIALSLLAAVPPSAHADVSVGIGISSPGVSIGLNFNSFPDLAPIPGYPVYYAPRVSANYFFYDGLYWVFVDDNWYSSSWYNGPWVVVQREIVPVYLWRVPVRYYRVRPVYFRGWHEDAPPRWDRHWGPRWVEHYHDWDHWDRRVVPPPAPLPLYQRQYAGPRYPAPREQVNIRVNNYHYEPHETYVRERIVAEERRENVVREPRRDERQDRRDVQQDRRDVQQDRRDIQQDRRDHPQGGRDDGHGAAPAAQPLAQARGSEAQRPMPQAQARAQDAADQDRLRSRQQQQDRQAQQARAQAEQRSRAQEEQRNQQAEAAKARQQAEARRTQQQQQAERGAEARRQQAQQQREQQAQQQMQRQQQAQQQAQRQQQAQQQAQRQQQAEQRAQRPQPQPSHGPRDARGAEVQREADRGGDRGGGNRRPDA